MQEEKELVTRNDRERDERNAHHLTRTAREGRCWCDLHDGMARVRPSFCITAAAVLWAGKLGESIVLVQKEVETLWGKKKREVVESVSL